MKTLLLLIACSIPAIAGAAQVPFTVHDYPSGDGPADLVSFGVPFKPGELTQLSNVATSSATSIRTSPDCGIVRPAPRMAARTVEGMVAAVAAPMVELAAMTVAVMARTAKSQAVAVDPPAPSRQWRWA